MTYALPAYALRCGGKLVKTGDHTATVTKTLKSCGGTTTKTTSYVEHAISRQYHGVKKEIKIITPVETWIFNPGPMNLFKL